MRPPLMRFILVSLLLWTGCIIEPFASAQPTFPLSGRVLDSLTQTPLPGAEVQVSPVGKPGLVEFAITDANGSFSFNNLFAGKYTLRAAHAGYVTESLQQHGAYSTAVAVGPGLSATGLVFPLTKSAVISGIITDQDNEAVPHAIIELFRESITDGLRAASRAGIFSADTDGRYTTYGLPPGAYFLAVVAQPWYAQQYMAVTHAATEGPPSSKLDVAYPATFYPGAAASESASSLKLTAGSRFEANIVLTEVPAIHITFEPPKGAHLNTHLQTATSRGFPLFAGSMFFSPRGQIFSVAPGRYQISASWNDVSGQHSVQRALDIASSVTIDPSTLEDQRFVTAVVSGPPGIDTERPGLIALRDLTTIQRIRPLPLQSPKAHIRWPSQVLPASRYELTFTGPEGVYLDHITATNARVTGQTVEIPPSGPVTLALTLARGTSTMKGKVVQDGKGIGGAMVLLLRDDFSFAPSLIRRDQSDSDGTFSLQNIAPGHYTLLAIPTDENFEYARADVMQAYLPRGKKIEIAPGTQYNESITFANTTE